MADHALLERIQRERGYTLSYHIVYGHLEPTVLEKWGDLYRTLNLVPRRLTNREREIIWIALLTAQRQRVGSLHLDRAVAAGVPPEEMRAAVALAAAGDGWTALAFGAEHWAAWLQSSPEEQYQRLVDTVRGTIEPRLADLALLTVQAIHQRAGAFTYHLRRLHDAGAAEVEIAEALSYLLPTAGAPTLLWATDRWFDALRAGVLPPSPTFGVANFETLRA
ncbi:MAG: carboxymuconolactone decarboxylase family protein [Chloroflexota bacterium]|nr:carboxymuconolactone decarboxylase family protein [Dehalococcoidia bacterium]MDW8253627.1 carboxymuconolactone decarboxylase family protein [Chloroflexota bacterium]